jgi:hypothetical protein
MDLDIMLLDYDAGPYAPHQLVFGDEVPSRIDQSREDAERFRPDWDGHAVRDQTAAWLQPIPAK